MVGFLRSKSLPVDVDEAGLVRAVAAALRRALCSIRQRQYPCCFNLLISEMGQGVQTAESGEIVIDMHI